MDEVKDVASKIEEDSTILKIIGDVLLFILTFDLAATVSIEAVIIQIKNKKAIFIPIFLQFTMIPLLGFLSAKCKELPQNVVVILLIVTSSPSGNFTNWWSSVFNAELALSIGISTISAIIALLILPLNVMIYSRLFSWQNSVAYIDFEALYNSLGVYISGLSLGLIASCMVKWKRFHVFSNIMGNIAGLILLVFSFVVSNIGSNTSILDRPWYFFVCVGAPFYVALLLVNVVLFFTDLTPPQKMTVSCDCTCQNIAIATSVALNMCTGEELAVAVAVPFVYGIAQAIGNIIYGLACWKAGWSKAPIDVPILTFFGKSFELEALRKNYMPIGDASLDPYRPRSPDCVTRFGCPSGTSTIRVEEIV
eukprot:CAMPEP_0185730440 /NCGR_PEP_ID=MMETSP1171-20130828/9844_1 /TAXON_ID=374046 /ORGANISM="Helicotheca tamensis, Strain CCMP826" /LENGTH=364 /DNA_ID=CAMNT_0028399481 /DNA_START=353 /DNA_END=1447 /DNA_ORIENTATION=-